MDRLTWVAALDDDPEATLTRKRSLVQIQYGPRYFSKSCLALRAEMGARLLRFCPISAGHGVDVLTSARTLSKFWSVLSERSATDTCRVHIQESRTSPTAIASYG